VPFGPAEVHPQQHLGPVGRFGAAGTRADRQQGRALVVLRGEEQGGPLPGEVGFERCGIAVELGGELVIGRFLEQLDGCEKVVGTGQQLAPCCCFAADAVRLAEDLLGVTAVVPEACFLGQCLDLGDPCVLGLEVKDAPRSTGSVQPGRGWRRLPPSSVPGDPGAGSGAAR
jgi:hypothetical protein